jgi:hypothetical protein
MSSQGVPPEQFLLFVELDEFADDWEAMGLDRDIALWDLQNQIMSNPTVGAVVSGTGGLRKMRFGRTDQRIGKRGGVRVCYVHFPKHAVVLLIAAYGKNEKDDLTAAEKKAILKYIDSARSWLERIKK